MIAFLKLFAKRWWFLGMFIVYQLIPPYASTGYPLNEWGNVNAYILMHPIKIVFAPYFPVFKILPVVIILYLILGGNWAGKLFNGYIAVMLLIFSIAQNTSITEKFGLAICLANVFTFITLAWMWVWPSTSPRMEYKQSKPPFLKWIILGLALVPFWEPVDSITLLPNFDPVLFLTSGAGLSFCMLMPLLLSICIWNYPNVNRVAFLSTSFMGLWMGLGNFLLEFVLYPQYWWIGVLHVPLVVLSFIGLVLEWRSDFSIRGGYVGNES